MNTAQADRHPPGFADLARFVPLDLHVDARGCLQPLDFDRLPFVPRRIFTVAGVPPGTVRGEHGHRSAQQLLACVQGRVELVLRHGPHEAHVTLEPTGTALWLAARVWSRQTYVEAHSVLLVLASEPFDPASYDAGGNIRTTG